jgi:hypothetical protein
MFYDIDQSGSPSTITGRRQEMKPIDETPEARPLLLASSGVVEIPAGGTALYS